MNWKKQAEKYAREQSPKESCGLLAVFDGVEKFWPCKNIAKDEYKFFAIDPEDWANCEDQGGKILGVFHSHPDGPSQLSEADTISCEKIGYPYFVYSVSLNDWTEYKPLTATALNSENQKKQQILEKTELKNIRVYGKLKEFLGQSCFQAAVQTPIQAINFLKANFVGLEKHMNEQIYKIKMGGNVFNDELLNLSGSGDIQIIPVAIGSGWFDWIGDVFDTIGDVVSDVVNFVADNALTIGITLLTGGVGNFFMNMGMNLLLNGVNQLLSPNQSPSGATTNDTDPNIRGSYNFNGIQNVATSGVPIPIMYGTVFSGSIIVSSGISTAQIVREI